MTVTEHGPVVLGLGNVLLGDDGVGPAVCALLRHRPESLPPGTRLLDGGTLGTSLVPWLLGASAVVLVDSVRAAAPPGAVLVYRAPEWSLGARADGVLPALLRLASIGGLEPEAVTVIGVVPARTRPGLGLSRPVQRAVPVAASVAAAEIRSLTGGIA